MMFIIVFLLLLAIVKISQWQFFIKAGTKPWYALIPVYSSYVFLRIIEKPWWWLPLIFIPGLGLVMQMLMLMEYYKCLKRHSLLDQTLGVILFFIYMPYFAFNKNLKFTPVKELPKIKYSSFHSWTEAIVFAVVGATAVRVLLLELYVIPTSSMEKSLLIGDYLFVSKVSYGARIPNTPLFFPFAHHTLPWTKDTKSYLEWIKLPYFRMWGLGEVKNNDIVVFNYPMEDFRPVDKRENYVKRCIAIAGDKLQIKDGVVFVNDKQIENPENAQTNYLVQNNGNGFNKKKLHAMDITETNPTMFPNVEVFTMSKKALTELKKLPNVLNVEPIIYKSDSFPHRKEIFPHDPNLNWTIDNYGPIYVPKKGEKVKLTPENIKFYERIIKVYEGNSLEFTNNEFIINGNKTDTYTFKMNYYFMMGDNRHNSLDSRFWGFVPEDHIVGKPVIVFWSVDKFATDFFSKIRWKRLFKLI